MDLSVREIQRKRKLINSTKKGRAKYRHLPLKPVAPVAPPPPKRPVGRPPLRDITNSNFTTPRAEDIRQKRKGVLDGKRTKDKTSKKGNQAYSECSVRHPVPHSQMSSITNCQGTSQTSNIERSSNITFRASSSNSYRSDQRPSSSSNPIVDESSSDDFNMDMSDLEECLTNCFLEESDDDTERPCETTTDNYLDMGDPICKCQKCGANMWLMERRKKDTKFSIPTFSLCCQNGKVVLPHLKPPPEILSNLLFNKDPRSENFQKYIRAYNMMFSFTSLGAKITEIKEGRGPPAFKISGQNYHRAGSLLPPEGSCPKFLQIYIYDTQNENANRMHAYRSGPDTFDESIINDLKCMIDSVNPLAKVYRMARDRFLENESADVKIKLIGTRTKDPRTYNTPSVDEVAALILDNDISDVCERDVILETQSNSFKRINELHPSFLALQYPLLFINGEDSYSVNIPLADLEPGKTRKRSSLSMREFFAYRIQDRDDEGGTILHARNLLSQFVLDGFSIVEVNRLAYYRANQKKFRSATYNTVTNSSRSGNTDAVSIGKRVKLPSSFTGGPRYMIENYQDAMAICRAYGNPDLFITFTCNPKWPEIDRFVKARGLNAQDRPDVVCRIFKMKLDQMIRDIKKKKIFGVVKALVYTVEFQKRGLPHAHIVVFLAEQHKLHTAEDIDKIIVAELPDPSLKPKLYEIVKELMMHGPCGANKPSSPCMKDGKCSKHFPKKHNDSTFVDSNGYPIYRRRDNGACAEKSGTSLDNRYVVPYNVYLMERYNAHINVEACNQTKPIKYLFKYISKGSDRITAMLTTESGREVIDEIKRFYDCRYISPCEAVWRLLGFDIHYRTPGVTRLHVHLPGEHSVWFEDEDDLDDVANRRGVDASKLLAWMDFNRNNPEGRHLTYAEFPTQYTWKQDLKCWERRKQGLSVGRIYHIHPGSGELYYLRLLLNEVKGATSYEQIRTVNGILYSTFREACYQMGMLDDEREYIDGIEEASKWGSADYLRRLFVMLLSQNALSMPNFVWEKTWHLLAEDVEYNQRKILNLPELQLSEEQLKNYALVEIEKLLQRNGYSLRQYNSMPQPDSTLLSESNNMMIQEELQYDTQELSSEHEQLLSSMTGEQYRVYEEIMTAVSTNKGGVYFLYGYGGTGKTYIWRALSSAIRSKGDVVITVASSGIAALLIPGGRTAHSRFHIPLDSNESSSCHIQANSPLAQLLIMAKLIIWDEAPMVKKYCFEALDRSMRDILRATNPNSMNEMFGGKVVVFGGDFRQILPVVPHGSRQDIVAASITSSYLWHGCKVLQLTKNMRLQQSSLSDDAHDIEQFANWILQVGNGEIGEPNDGEGDIEIPEELLITGVDKEDPLSSIMNTTYPDLLQNLKNHGYFRERAILSPTHDVVDEVNEYMMSLIPGDQHDYFSLDSICKNDVGAAINDVLYTSDFLNSVKCSGIPNHVLRLKVGAPVMLMRNIDQSAGLCNGTRMIVTQLGKRVIEAVVISGSNIGEKVAIARMVLSPSDSTMPFRFQRRQFPLIVCFAITINKSQGQSLSNVGLFLRRPVFTHGQFYVAVSRVTNKKGLKILILDKNNEAMSHTVNVVYQEVLQRVC